jgi:anti-anti-sigma factor
MSRFASALGSLSEATPSVATVSRGPSIGHALVLYLAGPFRIPISEDLHVAVSTALRQGINRIVLDLADVSRIDAAGVGELVRAYNLTVAVDGVLRVQNTPPWVRRVLELVGLFTILTNGERRRG